MPNDKVDPRPLTDHSVGLAAGGRLLSVDGVLKVVVLAVAYFVTGWLGLLLAIPPGYATAVWLPSGIVLAGVLRWGPRVWPGIWLGSFLVNVWVSLTGPNPEISFIGLAVAASIGVGSTLQALLGAFLLQRWVGVGRLFERGTAILAFAAIEALGCLLAPTWGVTSLILAGIVDWSAYLAAWRTWWLGDLIGVLIVTPVLLTFRELSLTDSPPWRLAEAIGTFTLLSVLSIAVFVGPSKLGSTQYPLAFLPLPCLVWIAFRFVPGSVALAALLLSGIAVTATSFGSGPFVRAATNESLFMLQAFMGLTTMTGLTLAASVVGQKQAEAYLREEKAKYYDLYDNAPDMFVSVDVATATVIGCNQTVVTTLGYTKQDLLGRPITGLYHPDCIEKAHKYLLLFQTTGEVHDAELQLKHKDGRKIDVSLNASAFRDDQGRIIHSRSVWRDITERKRGERQIRILNEELEQRVTERTGQLEGSRKELEQKNRDLETLLYVVSHDLREPLRSIENFSRLVHDRYAAHLDEKGQDFLRRVVRGVQRMDQLMTDILALSHAQRMEPPAEDVEGESIVREALRQLEDKVKETGATVRVAKDLPRLRGNRTWATQGVYNLIANALKFRRNGDGEAPEVEIATYQPTVKDGAVVGIVVRDRGPGVAPEHAERIFQLFQRAVGREVEGTGAGLAIVRQVAERYGGRAWVQPREGGGSEFIMTFGATNTP